MERLELNVSKREIGKSVCKKLRNDGNVPAILYGIGREPLPLFVNMKEADHVLSTEAGWNILLDLKIDGKEKVLARISDYQADVIRRHLTHIDFQVLDLKKKIKTEVPIRLLGKPEGVKLGGILEVSRRTLEVRCLPTNIPEHIDIDVSNLGIGGNVHISDVTLPEGVECIYETNFSIAAIVEPTQEIVAEVLAEAVPTVGGEAAVPVEGEEAKVEGKEGEAPAGADKKKEPAKEKGKEKE